MSKVRVSNFSISADGYGAGPRQSLDSPLGVGGEALHGWFVRTRTFKRLLGGGDGGETGPEDEIAARALQNVGAVIMGRNMFGPVRGPWPDDRWRGWWGNSPPFHAPVFVLTHHARASIAMEGGTTFHFVTDGVEAAFARARSAAADKDVHVAGGVSVVRQLLAARLVDAMHVAVSPVLLGSGEALFAGIDLPALGYAIASHVATPHATHYFFQASRS